MLFVLIDYLSRLDKFLKSDFSLVGALGYVLLKVPFMFAQLTPASILLATIVVFGLMNRQNELIAVKSSGISVYFLVKPSLISGGTLALAMIFMGETLIPMTMAKANYIKYQIIKKRNNIYAGREDIWIKSEKKLIRVNFYNPAKQSIAGVTITTMGDDFSILSRIDAKKGAYKNGIWEFEDIIEQTHHNMSSDYDVTLHKKNVIPLSFKPEDLSEYSKKSEEMSLLALKDYVQKVEREGYDSTTYRVDLNGKIAFPFICIIMVLTGAATGMKSFVKDNMPLGIALGVIIAFMYWFAYGFCISLGYGDILPPVLSAWAANIFFICFGILYLVTAE